MLLFDVNLNCCLIIAVFLCISMSVFMKDAYVLCLLLYRFDIVWNVCVVFVVCLGYLVFKLTWRRVQGDQECSDPGWRLTIALRWVEARDGP